MPAEPSSPRVITSTLQGIDLLLIFVDPDPVVPGSPHRGRPAVVFLHELFGLALQIILLAFVEHLIREDVSPLNFHAIFSLSYKR